MFSQIMTNKSVCQCMFNREKNHDKSKQLYDWPFSTDFGKIPLFLQLGIFLQII